jgi:hypothetical protein
MVVEGSAFSHSDLISITRYCPINGAITYKAHESDASSRRVFDYIATEAEAKGNFPSEFRRYRVKLRYM